MFFKNGYFYCLSHCWHNSFNIRDILPETHNWKEEHAEGIVFSFLGFVMGWRRENIDFILNDKEIKKIISKEGVSCQK